MMQIKQDNNTGFLKNILTQLPGLILVMDAESRFLYSNKYTAKLFGYDKEEDMLGLNAYGMRCPAVESADEFIAQDKVVLRDQTEITILDIHQYADGRSRILLTKKSPYYYEDKMGLICHCTEMFSESLNKICAVLIQSDNQYRTQKNKDRSYIIGRSVQRNALSQRELDCLFYLLRGKTMKEIAKILAISPRTVETYLEQIKTKLNCQTKSEIIEYGLSEGLLNYIPNHLLETNLSGILHTQGF